MAECNHVFIGRVDGVHCVRCGTHMNAQEYEKWLKQSSAEEIHLPKIELNPKRQTGKRGRTK